AALGVPEVDLGHAVLAEQACDVVATLRREQRIVGLVADVLETGDLWRAALAEVQQPGFAGIEQAIDEALARYVGDAHHAGIAAAVGQRRGGNVGDLLQGLGVEDLDAARLVVAHGDQTAVLADGAADAVAALNHALVDTLAQQVDLGQPAVAAEDIGEALVAGKHHGSVGQVAQPLDARQAAHAAALDQLQAAGGAFHYHAQVAGAAQGLLRAGAKQAGCSQQQEGTDHGFGYPSRSRSTSQTMSCSSSRAFQPGMAVPGLPWVTVAMGLSRGLPASASRVMAGPRPPVMRRPWQEPQSCTRRCSS